MTIQSVQLNNNGADSQNTRVVRSYREAEGPVKTKKKVHPLPPKGHLVDDNLATGTKYFFKDIAYDMKSVKDGYTGKANDHQLGRLNSVGLKLGGIGIATYLASTTSNPKLRLMEYIGLATFLTSMSLYPKIAINTPAKILHGYDIDKEYIDDQGRKKSVQQDSNYVPYDMYNGANKGEDLDAIGDRMGIPRDIKNRHDVIREQMRKIATQNNTLWMLTAGFATPLMTALLCCGLEKFIVRPGLEKSRNASHNSQIQSMLNEATQMSTDISNIKNSLGENVKSTLSKYEGKVIPSEEIEKITQMMTQDMDEILAEGIREDLSKMLSAKTVIKLDTKSLKTMINNAADAIEGRGTKDIIESIVPNESEIESLIKEIKPEGSLAAGFELTPEEFEELKVKIFNKSFEKIDASGMPPAKQKYCRSNIAKFKNAFDAKPEKVLTKESITQTINFAKILGEFKKKSTILDKCENFKFEYAPETVLANYYEKFQTTLIKQLGISPKDYKRMSNDKEFAKRIIDEKITALTQNEEKYKKTLEKLGKIMEEMETTLHGSAEDTSHIKDLINGIETVYGKTAERLTKAGIGESTATKLTNGTTSTISSREELFNLLDGITENKFRNAAGDDIEAIKYFSAGKGSSKNIKISRLISRYQGEVNSFFRIFHTLDFYKRAANPEELMKYASVQESAYVENVIQKIKQSMLTGNSSDFTLKLGVENSYEYKDLYNIGWTAEEEGYGTTRQKGIVTDSTLSGLEKNKKFNISERLQRYITRFKNIIANDKTDFTRPNHILDENIPNAYSDMATKSESKFNLVAQNPVDMIQKATGKLHADRMWLKTIGIMTGTVFGVTLLTQFCFGKLKNKHNLQKIEKKNKQKQVKNEPSR